MKKMTVYAMWIALISGVGSIYAQDSDPYAKKLLDQMYTTYTSAPGVLADFELILDLAESRQEIQKGRMLQKGDQYRVELASYVVYNNGIDLWMYLAEANECQITSALEADEESEVPNLNDILSMYRSGEFEYRAVEDGTIVGGQKIEFKPKDIDSEYFKMVLILDTKTNSPRSVKFFHKDGSRYTINIGSISFDAELADSDFIFDVDDYPGVYVEDLR